MSEIGEMAQVSTQVIKVTFDGAELAINLAGKLTKDSIDMMKKILKVLAFLHTKSLLNQSKRHAILGAGKTKMKFMEPGADFRNVKIDERERKFVEKLLKQYGVLYTKLPDLNRGDGMCEFLYNVKDISKINMVLERLNDNHLKASERKLMRKEEAEYKEAINQTMEDYLKNVSMEELDEALRKDDPDAYAVMQEKFSEDLAVAEENLYREASEQIDDEPVPAEDIKKNQQELLEKETFKEQLSKEVRFNEMERDTDNFIKISLDRSLVVDENETMMKFILPGTRREEFIWIDKNDLTLGENEKTFFGYLGRDKEYKTCSLDNVLKNRFSGQELFDKHLDPVRFSFQFTEKNERDSKDKVVSFDARKNTQTKPSGPKKSR
ncbi:MAG TPA: DUF3801 domain-containing protein [Lachnospiraceae bacterium]|nr:DUF3801 domain-containing protein [Lachnospiraceae bacterium]